MCLQELQSYQWHIYLIFSLIGDFIMAQNTRENLREPLPGSPEDPGKPLIPIKQTIALQSLASKYNV